MSYAIIGFGDIGQALAKAFGPLPVTASKYPLQPSATRKTSHPLRPRSAPTVIPKTLADAVKADVILLAVRFEAHPMSRRRFLPGEGRPPSM